MSARHAADAPTVRCTILQSQQHQSSPASPISLPALSSRRRRLSTRPIRCRRRPLAAASIHSSGSSLPPAPLQFVFELIIFYFTLFCSCALLLRMRSCVLFCFVNSFFDVLVVCMLCLIFMLLWNCVFVVLFRLCVSSCFCSFVLVSVFVCLRAALLYESPRRKPG